ncbi:MAG: MBL fold metallo-hydrolase [Pseudomonadota bacterium]
MASMPLGARASAPQSERFELGDVTVHAISDGHFDLPAGAFQNVGTQQLPETVHIGATVWVISTPTREILVDAGSGDFLKARYPGTGQLAARLAELGVDPKRITDVVITHMHADHIGGLLDGETKLFPSAELHVSEVEWRYWMAEERPSQVPDALKGLAVLIQKIAGALPYEVALHSGVVDLGEGISMLPAPGHTPGHSAVQVASGAQQLLLLGDTLISGDLQFARPQVTYVLDGDPALAAKTRRDLFEMIASDSIAFCATHLNGLQKSTLEPMPEGFRRIDAV